MLRIFATWSLATFAFCAAIIGSAAAQTSDRAPGAACDDIIRRHEKLQVLLGHVAMLKDTTPVWDGYRPAAANYVFIVPGPKNQRCAALWHDGRLAAMFPLTAAPRTETPLYGFYRRDRADDASELHRHLEPMGVPNAVLLPLDGDARLGLSMSGQSWFVDMAVHEAFHLLVQFAARSGVESAYRWPPWTVPQPDREQLAARCYGSTNPQQQRLAAEREPLQRAATSALTNGALESVCRDARTFVAERRRRWSELISVEVPSEGGVAARSCPEAEAVMEMNEGVPAFVAWLTAHQLEVVDNKRLATQFNVQQRDRFYMTGTMQLTVLRRLLGDEFIDATARLASSPAWSAGAIFSTLEAELSRRCE